MLMSVCQCCECSLNSELPTGNQTRKCSYQPHVKYSPWISFPRSGYRLQQNFVNILWCPGKWFCSVDTADERDTLLQHRKEA